MFSFLGSIGFTRYEYGSCAFLVCQMIEGRSDRTVAIFFFFFSNFSSFFSFSSYFVWSRRAFSVYWSSQCLPYQAFYDYLHSTQLFLCSCWILDSAPCGCWLRMLMLSKFVFIVCRLHAGSCSGASNLNTFSPFVYDLPFSIND
ncbi:hypothetical protein BDV38DRAFT_191925 [Aspergillus pseudotamarii]|uniref:Uncharacterized protein n=1 Tax=Aspergillus pseudotamarii TaxID=132259 RepID=A0A5N6SH13_ASPPS|nr:uncharacterized protein BDV38DRAFT_191925 [Aspergillus pseudotamarii]KAE8133169.1 hypothetical protein BDV38DRAFT_191925 [Aspergillus pseudotamarii]